MSGQQCMEHTSKKNPHARKELIIKLRIATEAATACYCKRSSKFRHNARPNTLRQLIRLAPAAGWSKQCLLRPLQCFAAGKKLWGHSAILSHAHLQVGSAENQNGRFWGVIVRSSVECAFSGSSGHWALMKSIRKENEILVPVLL